MYGRFNWLVRAVCIVWFCLFAVQVNAGLPSAYIKTKYGYSKKINGGGTWKAVRTDYIIETGNIPEGATIPRNKQISVVYPKGDVIAKGKQFKKASPFNLAVIAAVEAAGWAIDELSGQITKPTKVYEDGYIPGKSWGSCSSSTIYASTLNEACKINWHNHTGGTDPDRPVRGVMTSETGASCQRQSTFGSSWAGFSNICLKDDPNSVIPDPTIEWLPISDADETDIIDKALGRASERQLKPLFADPYSNPYNWEPFWDAVRDWMRDVADRDPNDNVTYDPVNNRWVIGSPAGGPDVNIEVKPVPDPTAPDFDPTENPGSSTSEDGQFELPAFCDWATVVCEWLEWTKEEPEEMEPDELPVDELTVDDFRRDYSSGLGSGSCPAPVSFTLQGQTAQFSYEDACWAAESLFKPVLLTIAGIMAAFIIVGASRRAV